MRLIVREWLDNIKHYAELRDGWSQRLAKWLVDRFLIRLKVRQRRAVLMILLLNGMAIVSLATIGIGLAVAKLL